MPDIEKKFSDELYLILWKSKRLNLSSFSWSLGLNIIFDFLLSTNNYIGLNVLVSKFLLMKIELLNKISSFEILLFMNISLFSFQILFS